MKQLYRILIVWFAVALVSLVVPAAASATTLTANPSQVSDTIRFGFNGSVWQSTTSYCGVGYSTGSYYRMTSGIRFNNVIVPKGATIVSASLVFTAYPPNATTATVNSVIQGEAADNPQTFYDYNNFVSHSRTIRTVYWDRIPAWQAEGTYTSPDIAPVIREIVERANWNTGNSIVVFWSDSEDRTPHFNATYRIAYAYGGNTSKAPKLQIEYTVPATTPVYTPTPTPTIAVTVADVSNQIIALNNQVTKLQAQVATLQAASGDASAISKTVSGMTTTMAQITQNTNTINSGVANLANKVVVLNENQNKMQAELNNIRSDLEDTADKIAALRGLSSGLLLLVIGGFLLVLASVGAVILFIKKKLL